MKDNDSFFVLDESRRVAVAINHMFDTDNANLLIVSAQSGFGKSYLLEEVVKRHGISQDWKSNENQNISEVFWSSNREDLVSQIIANDRSLIDPETGYDNAKIIVIDNCDNKQWFLENIDLLEIFASTDPWERYLEIPDSDGERHPLESKIIILSTADLLQLAAYESDFEFLFDSSDVDTVSVPRYGQKEELDYLHVIYPNIPLYNCKFESKSQELEVRTMAYRLLADNLNIIKNWESLIFKFSKVATYVFFHLEEFRCDDISDMHVRMALDN